MDACVQLAIKVWPADSSRHWKKKIKKIPWPNFRMAGTGAPVGGALSRFGWLNKRFQRSRSDLRTELG